MDTGGHKCPPRIIGTSSYLVPVLTKFSIRSAMPLSYSAFCFLISSIRTFSLESVVVSIVTDTIRVQGDK